jgi:hypothetical protein
MDFIHDRFDTAHEKLLLPQTAAEAILVQVCFRSGKSEPSSALVGDPFSSVLSYQLR